MPIKKSKTGTKTKTSVKKKKSLVVAKTIKSAPRKSVPKKTVKPKKKAEISVRLVAPQVAVKPVVKTEKEIVEEAISQESHIYNEPQPRQEEPIIANQPVESIATVPDDSKLIEEIAARSFETNTTTMRPAVKQASSGWYRKIAYGFIFFTAVLLAAIFYLSFVKVSITIVPKQERISDSVSVNIYDESVDISETGDSIKGAVTTISTEQTKKYPASGVEIIGEEAVGKVTIFNNYNKSQSLVATTRLLTPDNKLFRIKNTVNIPAGKSADVEIYADDPSPAMAIGPTKFTIPGLWAGLQDKIYAESKDAVEYKQKTKKFITQADIDNGVMDLKKYLLANAKDEVVNAYKNYSQIIYDIDSNSMSVATDAKVNEEREEFSVTIKTSVAIIAFNDDKIFVMAREKLSSRIPDDKELSGFSKDNIVYSMNDYDIGKKTANIKASFEGLMSYRSDSDIIDKSMLPGLDKSQLTEFLDSKSEIEDYEVKFYPSFINKVPSLTDRIEVNIKKSSVSSN